MVLARPQVRVGEVTCGVFDLLACVPQGIWDALDTWRIALSLWPWFLAAGVAGMILGAWLGPGKTAMLITGGLAIFFLSRRDDAYPTDLPAKDAAPSFRKPKVTVRRTSKRAPTDPPKSLS